MITMNELVDLRMQQHIAHEIYRQQIMQRIPDPFPPLLPMSMPRHVIMPPRVTLPGVEVTLQNDDLWNQFHQIGTEMIITKSGRRMFPSMRLSLSGLEDETNYCILLEMVPIGDCRYKFSGSQWVPAGGAEPQSPQRMCLHPDSPATGAHWQAQPILFNKVKLTNNTLDNNGHIVLASMHKYQPRIHVIRTSDLAQIPWAPQQAFVFPETEFVAVTAYQNDRITKLKIDNNPFAKGFRETGQSRCKRKMSSSPTADDQQQQQQQMPQLQQQQQHHQLNLYRQQQQHRQQSPTKSLTTTGGLISESASSSICMDKPAAQLCFPEHHLAHQQQHHQHLLNADTTAAAANLKRLRTNTSACSLDGSGGVSAGGGGGSGGGVVGAITNETSPVVNITPMDYINNAAGNIFPSPTIAAVGTVNNNNNNGNNNGNSFASNSDVSGSCNATSVAFMHHLQQNMQSLLRPSLVDLACTYFARPQPLYPPHVYAVAAQHEALVAATQQQQQQPSLPALTQATSSLLLPPHRSLVHDAATNLSADDDCTGTGGAGDGDGDGELPNRVMAINSNTTLECITNDADLSSSDSSLIQDESNTAAMATPTPTPLTTPTAMSSSATCNTNDDTLFPSPSASNNNSSIICRNHNNNNNNHGNNGHKAKRKGFSISAILGGGS